MRYFLLSWDQEGFECIQDITANHPDNWDKAQLMNALKSNKVDKNPILQQASMMVLRARYNTQRHPEIYVIGADDDIELDAIQAWSESDPQGLVDWVRERHYYKIFDGRADRNRLVIK